MNRRRAAELIHDAMDAAGASYHERGSGINAARASLTAAQK